MAATVSVGAGEGAAVAAGATGNEAGVDAGSCKAGLDVVVADGMAGNTNTIGFMVDVAGDKNDVLVDDDASNVVVVSGFVVVVVVGSVEVEVVVEVGPAGGITPLTSILRIAKLCLSAT